MENKSNSKIIISLLIVIALVVVIVLAVRSKTVETPVSDNSLPVLIDEQGNISEPETVGTDESNSDVSSITTESIDNSVQIMN